MPSASELQPKKKRHEIHHEGTKDTKVGMFLSSNFVLFVTSVVK